MYSNVKFYEKDNELHEVFFPIQLEERGSKGATPQVKIQIPLISMIKNTGGWYRAAQGIPGPVLRANVQTVWLIYSACSACSLSLSLSLSLSHTHSLSLTHTLSHSLSLSLTDRCGWKLLSYILFAHPNILPSSTSPMQFMWHFCCPLLTLRHSCTSCFWNLH